MSGEVATAGTLIALLEESDATCPPYLRLKVVEALGRLRVREAVQPLQEILEARHLFHWTHPTELRAAAMQALDKIVPDWAQTFSVKSGLEEADLAIAPLDPQPFAPWGRQRRYPRIRLPQTIAATCTGGREGCRLEIKQLSLSGGLGKFDRHLSPGTILSIRTQGMRPLRLHAIVRNARTQGLAFEILEMGLDDRNKLRHLLAPYARPVTPSSPEIEARRSSHGVPPSE